MLCSAGCGRWKFFFKDQDREEYLQLLREQGDRFGVKFLAYCLMTNHVHLLAIPELKDSLARGIGEAHRRYTRMINFRERVSGYLFQGRFSSCPVATDIYFTTTLQYILRNPVKANMVQASWDYPWSSAAYHCGLVGDDLLVQEDELLAGVANWQKLLSTDSAMSTVLEEKNRTGRPFGAEEFYTEVEKRTGIDTRPGTPGRPKRVLNK
jgi:putative transposase